MLRLVSSTCWLLTLGGCPADETVDSAPPRDRVSGAHSSGNRYHVVRIDADPIVATAIITPPPQDPARFASGLPVLVFGYGGLEISHCSPSEPSFPLPGGPFGAAIVIPLRADECCLGLCGEGENDLGGPAQQQAFLDTWRFASGQALTTDGLSLADIVGRDIHGDAAGLLLSSAYGVTALAAMSSSPESMDTLGAIGLYEVPIEPWALTTALGDLPADPDTTVDGDGNGCPWDDGRNIRYQPGSCPAGLCALDLSGIGWAPAPEDANNGSLFLDNNGNGHLDLRDGSVDLDGDGAFGQDEDFILEGYCSTASTLPFCWQPTDLLQAALDQGVLDTTSWPAILPTPTLASEFWRLRDAVTALSSLPTWLPDLRWEITGAWRDHGVAQVTRPHLVNAYDLLDQAGARVIFQPSHDAFLEVLPDGDPDYDRLDWNAALSEQDVVGLVLPEPVDKEHARAMTSVEVLNLLLE